MFEREKEPERPDMIQGARKRIIVLITSKLMV